VRISVDTDVCALNGECTYAAPDVFRIDGDELVYDAEPDPSRHEAVRAAYDACPTLAIELEEG
jgi:ferredoxin